MCVSHPMISVILPVYNAENYLQECIDSVLAQSYENFELLLIDDCSNDGSARIMRENAAKDPRIKLFRNKQNRGVSVCRNLGIREAAGDYLAFLDSDDVWVREKLMVQLQLLKRSGAQLTYSAYDFIDETSQPILKPHGVPVRLDYPMLLRENSILCSSVCVEAGLLKAHPFRSAYYHEDYVLWLELLQLPIVAVGSNEILTHYRISKGSRSYRKGHAAVERWRIYRKFLKLNPLKSAFYFVQYAINGIKKYYL